MSSSPSTPLALQALKASLAKRIGALLRAQKSSQARDLGGLHESAEACLRLIKDHLVSLPDERVLSLTLTLGELFEQELEALWGDAYSEEESLWGAVKAGRRFVERTLSVAPWCELSEAELMQLCEELLCALGATPSGVGLVTSSLASCEPLVWVERGLSSALEALLTRVDEAELDQEGRPRLEGLWLSGVGASAHLAWAHRALLEQGVEVLSPLPAAAPWSASVLLEWLERPARVAEGEDEEARALLLDDMHLADRPFMWALAHMMSHPRRPALLVWSGAELGAAASLAQSLSRPPLTLELAPFEVPEWRSWAQKAGGERSLSAREPALSPVDQLRLATLAWRQAERGLVSMITLPSDEERNEHEGVASLLGPLCATEPLVGVIADNRDVVEGLLTFSGYSKAAPNEAWGVLWESGERLAWGERLADVCARVSAERAELQQRPQEEPQEEPQGQGAQAEGSADDGLISKLQQLEAKLTRPELSGARWGVLSALKRLAYLQGRAVLTLPMSTPDPQSLHEAVERLSPALTQGHPHPLTLGVLCALAFEWGSWGPRWGLAREAMSALRFGVTAAERLNDPLKGARLLSSLGALALSEGLAEPAKTSLEAASQLLSALRRPQEASQSLYRWAEAELLSGELNRASKLLERAERLMEQLSYPEGRWAMRFKRGQLARSRGEAREALALLAPLPLEGVGEAMTQGLLLERAAAALSCEPPALSEAREAIEGLKDDLTRELFTCLLKGAEGDEGGLQAALTPLINLNQAREVGAWLLGTELWAQALLRLKGAPEGSLEALTRALEGAIKGAVALRSRLQLAALYELLARCYERRGQREEAVAALAFSEGWRERLKGEVSSPEGSAALHELRATLKARPELERQVSEELEQLLSGWSQRSVSELSAQLTTSAAQRGER